MVQLLRAQQIPVWGSDRPQTLVWLVVEDRSGSRRVLDTLAPQAAAPAAMPAADDDALIDAPAPEAPDFGMALADAAQRFGIPVRLPRYDETDQSRVTESDLWGGFTNIIAEASARYGADSILVGRVSERRPASIQWTWLFAGEETRFRGDMNAAFSRISGRMMSQFASSPEGSADVRISVVGVDGLSGYVRLMQFVNSRSLIEAVRVVAVRGDQVLLAVDALAGRERLERLLSGTVLEPIAPPVRAVPFAGSAGDRVVGRPDAPVQIGEIASGQVPVTGGIEEPVLNPILKNAPRALDDADLFFRLRPGGSTGD